MFALTGGAALLAAVGWVAFLLSYRQTHNLETSGLFPRGATYLDLTTYIDRFNVLRTPAFFEDADPSLHRSRFAYPPAAALCYAFLYRSHHMKFVYNLLSAGLWLSGFACWGTALWRQTHRRLVSCLIPASMLLLSYPAVFLFERANIEIFLWALLIAAVLLYRSRLHQSAAVCLGAAAALKLYPILLLGLFVSRRRDWTAFLTGLLTAVAVTVGSIVLTAPGFFRIGALGYLKGITGFQTKYAGSMDAGPNAFDHSLFSWLKQVAVHAGHNPTDFTKGYYLVCAMLAGVSFLLWVRHRPFLNQLTFLIVCMVLLPPVSFEYTLVHLYLIAALLSLTLLGRSSLASPESSATLFALACVLMLLLPVNLFGPLTGIAGQVQTIPLLCLAVAAAAWPWTELTQRPDFSSAASAFESNEAALA
jgi:hypothetical protein